VVCRLGGQGRRLAHVRTRSFFGFTALYRKKKMFALRPHSRGMETPNSLAFELETKSAVVLARPERDSRITSAKMQTTRWFTFEVSSSDDLRDALHWLGQADEAAGPE
jgi:hypothetical protein